MALGNRNDK